MDNSLERLAAELQRSIGLSDMDWSSHSFEPGVAYSLVIRFERLKLKMYQERGHLLPHLHVDYGKHNHVASYSIDPTERLEGSIDRKYDRLIISWIEKYRGKLLELWSMMQSGESPTAIIAELQAGSA